VVVGVELHGVCGAQTVARDLARLFLYNGRVMIRNLPAVLYVVAMVAVIVVVDVLFFRNRFWERLMVNIGIVLVFGAFYLRFLKNH